MLDVVDLTKRYPSVTAVDRISFTLGSHEIVGYLGPNGSGKTTTVNMVTGLLEPTKGRILFRGRNIEEDLVGYRRHFGYVPEEPALYGYLSGIEYLELVGRLRAIPGPHLAEVTDRLLHLLGLHEQRHAAISSYSKGMRQKVLIAAALLHDPDLLILDEPFSGLDVESALVLRDLVKALARAGKAILFSSHVLDVVERLCTRVIILNRGRIVADDSVERLRELSRLPSLEDVFAQLVVQQNTERTAGEIVELIRGPFDR
ncbi:MAG: ABC transporter ATP-binding protein [Acidobacteriota bacterium]